MEEKVFSKLFRVGIPVFVFFSFKSLIKKEVTSEKISKNRTDLKFGKERKKLWPCV